MQQGVTKQKKRMQRLVLIMQNNLPDDYMDSILQLFAIWLICDNLVQLQLRHSAGTQSMQR